MQTVTLEATVEIADMRSEIPRRQAREARPRYFQRVRDAEVETCRKCDC
jgi:hypothetical protein